MVHFKCITVNREAMSPDPSDEAFETKNCFPLVLDINQTCNTHTHTNNNEFSNSHLIHLKNNLKNIYIILNCKTFSLLLHKLNKK